MGIFHSLDKMYRSALLISAFYSSLPPLTQSNPLVALKSQLPAEPIEDPALWAWGRHPDNGLDYAAKNGFTVEFCLENPDLIRTAKCKLPLEDCLANPEYISLPGCLGNTFTIDTCLEFPDLLKRSPRCLDAIGPDFEPTLFQCQDNKEILCKMNLCEKHKFIVKC